MNGDKMLKTYTPFSIVRKLIIENMVENGANIFYATVAADRILSKVPFYERYFRIEDEEKLIQKVYAKYQKMLMNRTINLRVLLQIMFFLLLMFVRFILHSPFNISPKSNLTFTFGLPQINLSMPMNQFHKFLNQKKFRHLLDGRLVVIENRKKSPLKDSKFRNTIQTFDIYMYMYKELPTYRAKFEVLHLSICRLFLVLIFKKRAYSLIAIEYIIQDPIWIVAKNFYGQVDTISTQSNVFKLSMIFYHSKCCGISTNMFWYSANSIPLTLKDSRMAIDNSYLIQSNIRKHFVWNDVNASLVARYNLDCKVEICGSILFYTNTPQAYSKVKANQISVIIFDVTPFSSLQGPVLYTDELVTCFLKDIFELLKHNKKNFDISIRLKNKRIIVNNPLKKSIYPIGQKYSAMVEEIKESVEVVNLKASLSLYDLIRECDLVLGLPFTSPVLIGQELGIPSAFYMPEMYTDFKIPNSFGNIRVLKGKKQLHRFFSKQFYN